MNKFCGGGIRPESTVDYYQRLIKLYQKNITSDGYSEIIINSVNMTAMLADAVHSLYKAGADFAFLASNTPHMVFERLRQASPILLVRTNRRQLCPRPGR
ncbi:MAG: hypothetical protein EOM54_13885 [Clostridia bacterium]|nr:hypothetical protein [Clostridia bacterium]